MTVRVLVADDQDLVRTGLSMILDPRPDIEVVGQGEGRARGGVHGPRAPTGHRSIRHPDARHGRDRSDPTAGRGRRRRRLAVIVVASTLDLDEYVRGHRSRQAELGSCSRTRDPLSSSRPSMRQPWVTP